MDAQKVGGAGISARARTPSIDLAPLATMLASAVPLVPPALGAAPKVTALPFAQHQDGRLRVNLRGVLQRLFTTPGFTDKQFKHRDDSGLLRDIELPPKLTTAKVGGRLLPGSEAKTTQAIEKLYAAVAREIDACLPDSELSKMTCPSAQQALQTLQDELRVRVQDAPATACLVPVTFTSADRPVAERSKDVARVLSAVEQIDGRDWLETFLAGFRRLLENNDVPDEEIPDILHAVREQRRQPGSQVQRFFEFLDDEALSRVRLQVTFKLMQVLASQTKKAGFKEYVRRVISAFELFAGASSEPLEIDPSKVYGKANKVELGDYLRTATFYSSLCVWPEWSVQLIEARTAPQEGFSTLREVSYRFRVNGDNPETGKSAFLTRLDRIDERLLDEPGADVYGVRHLAWLVFLTLVTPDSLEAPTPVDVKALAERIAADIERDPVRAIGELVSELRINSSVMDGISRELQSLLTERSNRLVDAANRTADRFRLSVHKNVVDLNAATSMSSTKTEILVKADRGLEDKVAWLANLTVADDGVSVPGAIASYTVETTLVERCLTPHGNRVETRMERSLDAPVLPMRLVPYHIDKDEPDAAKRWKPMSVASLSFDFGCGVDFEFDPKAMGLSKTGQNTEKADFEQMRAATCVAFALLAYAVSWNIVRRLKAVPGNERLSAMLLRMQPRGKDVESTDGNAAIYAIAQALERTLSRELPTKMQGFHTGGSAATDKWRRQGTVAALRGGQPIRTRAPAGAQPVAVLSYATRPCDVHPAHPDADGYIFLTRTYRADPDGDGMMVALDGMRARLVESRKAFTDPQPILEEIARLRNEGYRHIILLSHHFGNRHIGRAAERHAPHGTFEFLEEASTRFPDTYLYPMRRDVFPATRLHRRTGGESAFEVLDFSEHQQLMQTRMAELRRGLEPVYTFATLDVVAADGRPQSGFCTYFFDNEQRLSNVQWRETVRQNMLGVGAGQSVREALVGVLRAVHFLEGEKLARGSQPLPVLDPFEWAAPVSTATAGELPVMDSRKRGSVLLSFPAVLAHMTKVLHKETGK